jgi:hypothetical protein
VRKFILALRSSWYKQLLYLNASKSMPPPVEILYAVPVGAIVAWYPPDAGTPPRGFALCNGDTVSDPESPFNNMPTPNLVGSFILGTSTVTTPPTIGGSVDFNLEGYTFGTGPTQSDSNDNVTPNVIIRNVAGNTQYRYDMTSDGDGWQDGNHHHVAAIPAPGWLALLYIMRIK